MLVKQRDNEIGILMQYLNKKKAQAAATGGQTMVGNDMPVMGSSKGMGGSESGRNNGNASEEGK